MENIGIIAGGGQFPELFIKAAKKAGRRVVVIAHKGETDENVATAGHTVDETLVIAMFRNPFEWVEAMRKRVSPTFAIFCLKYSMCSISHQRRFFSHIMHLNICLWTGTSLSRNLGPWIELDWTSP